MVQRIKKEYKNEMINRYGPCFLVQIGRLGSRIYTYHWHSTDYFSALRNYKRVPLRRGVRKRIIDLHTGKVLEHITYDQWLKSVRQRGAIICSDLKYKNYLKRLKEATK